MGFTEILKMSWESVRSNTLRSILTLLIIAVGIMALVGILTALDSALAAMYENFNDMGANSFTIERKFADVRGNRRGRRDKVGEPISFDQAMLFKERFDYPARVSISIPASGGSTVQRDDKKSNPNVSVAGIDENYFAVKGYELSHGRVFSQNELNSGTNKAIIGNDIVKLLFAGKPEKAIDADMICGNLHFTVIGVLKSKGSAGGDQSADRIVMIPVETSKKIYDNKGQDYNISVVVNSAIELDNASSIASGVLHTLRKIKPGQDDDFEVTKSDGLLAILTENTLYIRAATIAIGFITLVGAAIGLMNIMLVSVTERTREIGIRKALGATGRSILTQFLLEAIIICQLGGFVGIIFGILIGNIVSLVLGGHFVIPWVWILMGVVTCLVVGLFSGIYPAWKASKLDPIESLRYE
jgi:putative ABC transport system permease protein